MFGYISAAIFLIASVNAVKNCDKVGVLIYEDLACKPIYDKSDNCPIEYKCPFPLKGDPTKCYYKGRTLEIGERLVDPRVAESCDLGCYCSGERSRFSCAIGECGNFGPKPDGCHYEFALEYCCGNLICNKTERATCTHNGKEYKEGEFIEVEDSCTKCICKKGFKGKLEAPFCKRYTCGAELKLFSKVHEGCSPVYYLRSHNTQKLLCCPNDWICPDGTEEISGSATSNKQCTFGDKTLKVGQSFEKELVQVVRKRKVRCECRIPPLLTCFADF